MFDLKADYDFTITGFDANFFSAPSVDVRIYYRPAPHAGNETDSTSWTLLGAATGITPNPTGTATPLPIPINVFIPAGQTYAFYITTTNGTAMVHTNGTTIGGLYAADGILNFYQGTALLYPFTSPIAPRVWNGRIRYFTEHGVSYLWSTSETTPAITVQPASTTDYMIRVSDTTGCGGTDEVVVFVNQLPPVNAGADTSVNCEGEALQLNATGAHLYAWTPGDGLSDPGIANPTVTAVANADSMLYYLTGTDTVTGCINYDTLTVQAECGFTLVAPQAFTPNGDGTNDFFTIFGDNIDTYEIRIFNRWGEQVYYSTNAGELSQGDTFKGWNGEYKGKPQDTGVYVYYIKAGKGNSKPIERKGNVTLIR
jgi:gliding motility-associated-like protein